MTATDDHLQILQRTVRDARTLACPICSFTIDVPPVPVSDQLGAALGMSGRTLAIVHADQVARRMANEMVSHLDKHTALEWWAALERARAEAKSYYNTLMELTGQPVSP